MGIDRELAVVSPTLDLCICPICCDLLEKPVVIPNCEHYFCRECIDHWIIVQWQDEEVLTCPECRKIFSAPQLGAWNTPRLIRNLLRKFIISYPDNLFSAHILSYNRN